MEATMLAKPSLTQNRRIKAPPAKVFAALIDPDKIAQWFGLGEASTKTITTDPRPGGAYHFHFLGQSGETNDVMGVYREVVANERVVFTWAWKSTPERESLVTMRLSPDGDGTMLSLTHEQFFNEEARDRHNVGWTYGLDQLQALLEA
jgi:uncharacterized protein YndB with AHSA1/START domain